ncbi:MAG: inositol monophosphatase family protein [Pseudomonadota bacterium]
MLRDEIAVARRAALEAGKVLSGLFGKIKQITKKGVIDLVTEADVQAEKAVLDILKHHFPEDGILTEEAGAHQKNAERVWIIDPLDGTTNFAHTYPVYAVSIALEINGETVLGVVHDPSRQESFEAVRGAGAFLNRRPITVSQMKEPRDALLATGFPYYMHQRPQRVFVLFEKMLPLVQGVRRGGSAALDLCYIAAGRLDGMWEEGLKPWDTAAGSVIVEEAGGRLTDYEGRDYTPRLDTIVASNGVLHAMMLTELRSAARSPTPVRVP